MHGWSGLLRSESRNVVAAATLFEFSEIRCHVPTSNE